MKSVSLAALGLALALSGTVAAPALAKDKAPKETTAKPSDVVVKAAAIVQPAAAKQDWATVKAKADEVAPQIQTDVDKLYVGQWYVQAGQGLHDNATTSKGVDLMLASGKVPPENVKNLAFAQGQFAYQAGDYRKAATAMQQAIAAGSTEANAFPLLMDSLDKAGQRVAALQTLNDLATKAQAGGTPVPASWFERGFSMAYATKKTDPNFAAVRAAATELDKKWVAADPRGAVWHDVLLLYTDGNANDADLKADVSRLLLASNGLQGGNDYLEYAESVYLRYPGEAKAVLDAGVKKGVVNLAANRNATEINQIVTGKIPADKASLAASDRSARAAATGKAAVSTADAYLGYGDYAKAIDLYNVGLTKGGVDANVVNTRIGIAMFRSGDKAGAKAAFAKVTGPRKDLADFWTVLIDHPTTA